MESSQSYISCRERTLDNAISEANTQITSALDELRDTIMSDIIEKFRNALDEAISDGESAEQERSEVEDKAAELQDELAAANERIKELEAEVADLQEQLQPRLAL